MPTPRAPRLRRSFLLRTNRLTMRGHDAIKTVVHRGRPTRGQHTCERCHRIIGPTLTSTELDNAMKLNNATVERPNDAIKVPHLEFEGKFRVVCDDCLQGRPRRSDTESAIQNKRTSKWVCSQCGVLLVALRSQRRQESRFSTGDGVPYVLSVEEG